MNLLSSLFFGILLLLTSESMQAQEYNMPADITKMDKEDCITYKNDALLCIHWLQQNPLGKDKDKRMISIAFLLKWLSSCPEAGINILPYVDQFSDINSEFIALFMAGWAQYYYEKHDKNELACNMAGVKSVIDYYNSDKGIEKNAFLDKLVVIDKDGKLKKWVNDEMKKK